MTATERERKYKSRTCTDSTLSLKHTHKELEKNMARKSIYPNKTSHKRLIPEKISLDKTTKLRTS